MEFVDHDESTGARHYQPGFELERRHKELQLRRKKSDVLPDLPPKQITKLKMALSPKQQESYNKAESEGIVHLRRIGREVNVTHVLELITHLKQICNADPETGESCKFDDMTERLDVLVEQGHKALVFSQYTSDAFGVRAAMKALEKHEPLSLVGGMSHTERNAVIKRFKEVDKHKVLVISLMAGGQGLNLQEASYVFHLDRWWNPAVERQAEDRSHRFGQTLKVNVIKYSCIGTIEERIDEILERKQDLFDRLIDDVSIDISRSLTGDELFGLFGLEPTYSRTSKDLSTDSHLPGLALESRCAAILERKGYVVKKTPRSRDGGIDLIASMTDEVGITQELYIQCKDHARPVGVEVVRELIGVIPVGGNVIPV
jgi:SNF2 family DNA or RNA helicase